MRGLRLPVPCKRLTLRYLTAGYLRALERFDGEDLDEQLRAATPLAKEGDQRIFYP